MQVAQFRSISEQLPIADKQWYAIRTLLNCEKKVAGFLSEISVEHYLPLQQYTRIYGRRKANVTKPLIRNYLFVKIIRRDYIKILDTQFVLGFVKFGDQINAIPEREIDFIRLIVGEYQDFEVEQSEIAVGEEIEIIGGLLTGLKARMTERKGRNKVLVELQSVGVGLLLDVEEKYIRRIVS